jgi:hypothetical protein
VKLMNNPITDLTALVNNTGLGEGDTVHLENVTPTVELCSQVDALELRGLTVKSECAP